MPDVTDPNGKTSADTQKPGNGTKSTSTTQEEIPQPDPIVSPDPSTPDPAYDPATEEGT